MHAGGRGVVALQRCDPESKRMLQTYQLCSHGRMDQQDENMKAGNSICHTFLEY